MEGLWRRGPVDVPVVPPWKLLGVGWVARSGRNGWYIGMIS